MRSGIVARLVVAGTLLVVVIGLVGSRAAGPAETASPSATSGALPAWATEPGAVTGTATDGQFRLVPAADRAAYEEGDEILAEATVEFLGPASSTELHSGANGPVGFEVIETGGPRHVEAAPGLRAVELVTRLERGRPKPFPWMKSAAPATDAVNPAGVHLVDIDGAVVGTVGEAFEGGGGYLPPGRAAVVCG